jgi:hypothetical protein
LLRCNGEIESAQLQSAIVNQCVSMWLHAISHVLRHVAESELAANRNWNFGWRHSVGFLDDKEDGFSDLLRCHHFEPARRGWQVGAISHDRFLHAWLPKELTPTMEEPARDPAPHGFTERGFNPIAHPLDARTKHYSPGCLTPMNRAFHGDDPSKQVGQMIPVGLVDFQAAQTHWNIGTLVGSRSRRFRFRGTPNQALLKFGLRD